MNEINEIKVVNAKEHNLKNVSISIPKNSFTVVTGPSGSGKSSLAFDTIYVEGQRRYIESLSSYARQFLGQFQPPDVESITGLSPAIAIDQKTTSRNPRSNVGTITEIYDYLRILFARVGTLHCIESGVPIRNYTAAQISKEILSLPNKTKVHLMVPIVLQRNVKKQDLLAKFLSQGFSRIRVDKEILRLDDSTKLPKSTKQIQIIIDRLVVKKENEKRLIDSIEQALKMGEGTLYTLIGDDEEKIYSEHNLSPVTLLKYPDLEPRLFSFNSPMGACKKCNGLGETKVFTKQKIILDSSFSILQGGLKPVTSQNRYMQKMLEEVALTESVDIKLPISELPKPFLDIILNGTEKEYNFSIKTAKTKHEFTKKFVGIIKWLEKRYLETSSDRLRSEFEQFMEIKKCPSCEGFRLNPMALSTLINGKNISELSLMTIDESYSFLKSIKLTGQKKKIAEKILIEISSRLKFLIDVGVNYLSLNRSAVSLSGGESQRIRLATQIGSSLSGVLYVLDEPSIGLHQRDNQKLIKTLKELQSLGNTILVVEHDEDMMKAADFIIDMGPHAGIHGGEVVAQGTISDILKQEKSLTSQYLTGKKAINIPSKRIEAEIFINLLGASKNNINNIDIQIPLQGLTCVTGVSGSGKSTLIHEILVPAIKTNLKKNNNTFFAPAFYQSITGVDQLKSIIELDQSPIGRTPKSNPTTYTGLFDEIRALFAKTNEAKVRGYKAGRFSFNVKGGRCENCEGNGVNKIEMHFLPDVFITCPECHGKRYNDETLSVLYKGKSISDILEMTVEDSYDFFKNHKKMGRILKTLLDVGLGYIHLGQASTTLSGGEAQRMKLAKELSKSIKGKCLYVLDEPTTGLHFNDIKILLDAINNLVDAGHPVLIIEHNLDVIKCADYVIDLGPEGGDKGGKIQATGTPEAITKVKKSYTGQFLKSIL